MPGGLGTECFRKPFQDFGEPSSKLNEKVLKDASYNDGEDNLAEPPEPLFMLFHFVRALHIHVAGTGCSS